MREEDRFNHHDHSECCHDHEHHDHDHSECCHDHEHHNHDHHECCHDHDHHEEKDDHLNRDYHVEGLDCG